VVVHDVVAKTAKPFSVHARMAEVSHHSTFAWFSWSFTCVLEWSHNVIHRMVSILVPLSRVDYYWLLSVFHKFQKVAYNL